MNMAEATMGRKEAVQGQIHGDDMSNSSAIDRTTENMNMAEASTKEAVQGQIHGGYISNSSANDRTTENMTMAEASTKEAVQGQIHGGRDDTSIDDNTIAESTKGAIPHTFGAYDHICEVEHLPAATSVAPNRINNENGAIPHTFGAYDHITEVESLPVVASDKINDRNGAIPHTFGAYAHVTEVESLPVASAAHNNINDQNGAIPHTFGAYSQFTEVEPLSATTSVRNGVNDANGAIPHTFGAYAHISEVEQPPSETSAARNRINDENGAIPHTFGAYAQISEIEHQSHDAQSDTNGGMLRLRGEELPCGALTQAQSESYHKDGYVILPGAVDDSQVAELLEEALNVIKRIGTGGEGIIRHDMSCAGAAKKRPSPIGRVLATFEPEDKSSPNPFERRVARLGLSVHQKLPTFQTLTHSAFNRSIAKSLGYNDPRITQSQLIAKLAGIGGHLVPHQDGAVSFSDPPSAMTFWYALEDSTLENGCLCVAKGSHLTTPLTQRLTKLEDGFPRFVELEKPLWAQGVAEEDKVVKEDYEYEALEVKKGTLILFHGNLMHKSEANKSDKSRMAYAFSIVDGSAECPQDSYVMPEAGVLESLF